MSGIATPHDSRIEISFNCRVTLSIIDGVVTRTILETPNVASIIEAPGFFVEVIDGPDDIRSNAAAVHAANRDNWPTPELVS